VERAGEGTRLQLGLDIRPHIIGGRLSLEHYRRAPIHTTAFFDAYASRIPRSPIDYGILAGLRMRF
jgi:hypothetical protein